MLIHHSDNQAASTDQLLRAASVSRIERITFASAEQVRCRRVVTRSRSRSTGKYPSWKMGRMIQWESLNELHAFRLLDCDPHARAFYEQPCEIAFVQDGELKRHYPDVLVETQHGKEIWEIKSDSEALQDEIVARTAFLSGALRQYGFAYRLVLAGDLERSPRIENATILLRHGRRVPTECERECMRSLLKRTPALNWGDACRGTYGPKGRDVLCRLVLEGVLHFNIELPLSSSTQFLYINGGQ